MKRMIITLNGNEYLVTSRRAYAKAYAEAMLFPVDHKEKAKPAPVKDPDMRLVKIKRS